MHIVAKTFEFYFLAKISSNNSIHICEFKNYLGNFVGNSESICAILPDGTAQPSGDTRKNE